jgi:NAD(P)-dependent dehydrogenase (short-subunit alcohol dehydrogenase family)
MVDLGTIRQSNAALKARPSGFIAIFVGATSGIGASTLRELVKDLSAPRFYVVGRSKTRFSNQLAELKALNSGAEVVFIQTEISLLKNVDAVCEQVASKEAKVDLLFMSAGLLAFAGPHCEHDSLYLLSSTPRIGVCGFLTKWGQILLKVLTHARQYPIIHA